jgi:hypothetical protein
MFIKIVAALKKSDSEVSKDFANLITDNSRACVTGSSVLGMKLRKDVKAGDIDIFVDARGGRNNYTIIEKFYSKQNFEDNVRPILESLTSPRVVKKDFMMGGGSHYLVRTSNEFYGFNQGMYNLETYQAYIGENIKLNFIFIDNSAALIKKILQDQDLPISIPLVGKFPWNEKLIYNFLDIQDIYKFGDVKHLSTFILEYIEERFDFEELKLIYDFDKEEVRNIFEVALDKNQVFLDLASSIETSDSLQHFISFINSEVRSDLIKSDKKMKNEFNNPDEIHISEKFFLRFDIRSYHLPGILTESFFESTPKACEALASIIKRAKKYTKKGFKIIDDKHVLVELHSHIMASSLNLLNDVDILRVERRSTLASDKLTKKRVLFLNRMKILLTENKNALGIDYEDPEDNKIIPF